MASPPGSSRSGRDTGMGTLATMASTAATAHKLLPRRHSRASVEAVEFLLSACPRLAKSTLPLEQLGLLPLANGGGSSGSNADGGGGGAGNGGAEPSAGLGRLLPLQTLCLRVETPDPHTALIARALLRRSPEARDHPLPRALRHSARGSKYSVFVCNAATCLQHRRLAAEEAGEDVALLNQLQEIFTRSSAASPSTPPSSVPALAVPPPGSPVNGRVSPPPRPPQNPPPPRKSPRHPNRAAHLRQSPGGGTARGEREPNRHCESPVPTPRALCQALAARAARGLPPLGGSPRLGGGGELHLQGCGAARYAGYPNRHGAPAVAGSGLPTIRAQ